MKIITKNSITTVFKDSGIKLLEFDNNRIYIHRVFTKPEIIELNELSDIYDLGFFMTKDTLTFRRRQ